MPTITCPGCQKQYKAPASAAGKTATCKACGKRFRLGKKQEKPAKVAAAVVAPVRKEEPSPPTDDAFWDEALSEDIAVEAPTDGPRADYSQMAQAAAAKVHAENQPKKRWGFQWEKVAGGGATFLIAGGITIGLVFMTGRLFFWPAGIAVVGLFTMLAGFIGEEGIW